MIVYKVNVLEELKKKGWNTTRIQKEGFLSQGTYLKIKNGDTNINLASLNKLCIVLRCQPSDIIEVIPADEEKIKYF